LSNDRIMLFAEATSTLGIISKVKRQAFSHNIPSHIT
jgi:hypothetical protein